MLKKNKIILTSLIGNVIEYYEFTVFAVFAAQIGQAFFPKYNPFLQILFAQVLFGLGFVTRPLGSLVFGHFGDQIGRKKVLSYTILGMSSVTFFIGITPSFESIGMIAPILVFIFRLLQGFFVGGEGSGAALYMLEHEQHKNKGLVGGIVIASIVLGAFLATLVGINLSKFYGAENVNWRIAFFIGSAIGLVGLYLRFSLPETTDFTKVVRDKKFVKLPILEVIKHYWRKMIVIVVLGGVNTALSYTLMAYLTTHLKTNLHFDQAKAMLYSMYSLAVYMLMLLLFGIISNRFKFKNFINFFAVLIIIFTIPIFKAISSNNYIILIAGLTLLPLLSAGICAPAYPYIYKMFKTEIRYSGVAVSYNLGIAIFGGFAPAINTFITEASGLTYAPAIYLITLTAVYLLVDAIFKIKDFDERI